MARMDRALYKEIGMRIYNLRTANGFSRTFLAERIHISSKFLYEIENGIKGFTVQVLVNLAMTFGVSCDFIIRGDSEADNPHALIYRVLKLFSGQDLDKIATVLRAVYAVNHSDAYDLPGVPRIPKESEMKPVPSGRKDALDKHESLEISKVGPDMLVLPDIPDAVDIAELVKRRAAEREAIADILDKQVEDVADTPMVDMLDQAIEDQAVEAMENLSGEEIEDLAAEAARTMRGKDIKDIAAEAKREMPGTAVEDIATKAMENMANKQIEDLAVKEMKQMVNSSAGDEASDETADEEAAAAEETSGDESRTSQE